MAIISKNRAFIYINYQIIQNKTHFIKAFNINLPITYFEVCSSFAHKKIRLVKYLVFGTVVCKFNLMN